MNVLVTGATGFLGSHLAKTLAQRGYNVRALVRNTGKLSRLQGHDIETFEGNLLDIDSLKKSTDGQDIVFHNAGMVDQWGKRETFYNVNVDGTKNLLEACLSSGIKRFVHTSSLTVLGKPRGKSPMDETSPYTERYFEFYTETKILSEKAVLDYYNKGKLPVTVIRPGIIWGPGDTTILPRLERLTRKGLIFNIGKGNNVLCLTYISNLVEGLILAAESPEAIGQIYHITDDEKITSRTFFTELTKIMGLHLPAISIPFSVLYATAYLFETLAKSMRLSKPPIITRYGICLLGCDYNYDISRAKRELGYNPKTSFKEGMENTARWYKNERLINKV